MEDFRDEFKKMLETTFVSAKGSNIDINKGMLAFLNKVYSNIPDKLFRYRKLGKEKYALSAFKKGTISLCKAKCFSDKYDSLIFVDAEKSMRNMQESSMLALRQVLQDIKNHDPRIKAEKAALVHHYIEQGMSDDEIIQKMFDETAKNDIAEWGKGFKQREWRFRDSEITARIGCFTESVQSKFMWDTYADGYRGFALEYDLKEFVIKCFQKNIAAYVFPVIYTDERPDLTLDESNYFIFSLLEKKGLLRLLEPFKAFMDLNLLSPHKPYLYKDKEEYGHEREWRILYYDETSIDDYMEIPDQGCLKAIYYGPDITKEDYKELHAIALRKGIKEYGVLMDKNSRKYSLNVVPLGRQKPITPSTPPATTHSPSPPHP